MQKIILKLERDQARAVQQNFCPYLQMLIATKNNDARSFQERQNVKIVYYNFEQIRVSFEKKLLTDSHKLKFTFSYPEAVTFYCLLMELPIPSNAVWLRNVRQLIIDVLDKHVNTPLALDIQQ